MAVRNFSCPLDIVICKFVISCWNPCFDAIAYFIISVKNISLAYMAIIEMTHSHFIPCYIPCSSQGILTRPEDKALTYKNLVCVTVTGHFRASLWLNNSFHISQNLWSYPFLQCRTNGQYGLPAVNNPIGRLPARSGSVGAILPTST